MDRDVVTFTASALNRLTGTSEHMEFRMTDEDHLDEEQLSDVLVQISSRPVGVQHFSLIVNMEETDQRFNALCNTLFTWLSTSPAAKTRIFSSVSSITIRVKIWNINSKTIDTKRWLDHITRLVLQIGILSTQISSIQYEDEIGGFGLKCILPLCRAFKLKSLDIGTMVSSAEIIKRVIECIHLQRETLTNLHLRVSGQKSGIVPLPSDELTMHVKMNEDVPLFAIDTRTDQLAVDMRRDHEQMMTFESKSNDHKEHDLSRAMQYRLALALASCPIRHLTFRGNCNIGRWIPPYTWKYMREMTNLTLDSMRYIPDGAHQHPNALTLTFINMYLTDVGIHRSIQSWFTDLNLHRIIIRFPQSMQSFSDDLPRFQSLVHLDMETSPYVGTEAFREWIMPDRAQNTYKDTYFPSLKSLRIRFYEAYRRSDGGLYADLAKNHRLLNQLQVLDMDVCKLPSMTAIVKAAKQLAHLTVDRMISAREPVVENGEFKDTTWLQFLAAVNENQSLVSVSISSNIFYGVVPGYMFWSRILTRSSLLRFDTYFHPNLAAMRDLNNQMDVIAAASPDVLKLCMTYALERKELDTRLRYNRIQSGFEQLRYVFLQCAKANKGNYIVDTCIMATLNNPFLPIIENNITFNEKSGRYQWTNMGVYKELERWLTEQLYTDTTQRSLDIETGLYKYLESNKDRLDKQQTALFKSTQERIEKLKRQMNEIQSIQKQVFGYIVTTQLRKPDVQAEMESKDNDTMLQRAPSNTPDSSSSMGTKRPFALISSNDDEKTSAVASTDESTMADIADAAAIAYAAPRQTNQQRIIRSIEHDAVWKL